MDFKARVEAEKEKETRRATVVSNVGVLVIFVFTVVATMVISFATFVLALFALAPSWIYFFFDRRPGRLRFHALLAMNLAGTMPYFTDLWRGDSTAAQALDIMATPSAWLSMYGSCLVAVLLYWIGVQIMIGFLDVGAKTREKTLATRQRRIVADWGKGLADTAIAAMAKGETGEEKKGKAGAGGDGASVRAVAAPKSSLHL